MSERSFSARDFAEGLKQFKCYHYMYRDEPYLYLHSFVGEKDVLYDQFRRILVQDAVSKGAEEPTVNGMTERIAEELGHELDHAKAIMRYIEKKAQENRGKGKILRIAIPCGIGKSNGISYEMKSALESKEGRSLLILTDNNERLEKYTKPKFNTQLKEYFAQPEIAQRICLFTKETKTEALRRADHCQILLMSTQRYLHLSREELDRFTSYNGERRSMIIVDEQPEIEEFCQISISNVTSIGVAFTQGLPYSGSENYQSEKAWCTEYWKNIEKIVIPMFQRFDEESEGKLGYYHYLKPDDVQIDASDEERFIRFVRKYRSQLDTYQGGREYDKVTADIEAIFEMLHRGALFCSRNDELNTKTSFKLYMDRIAQFDIPDTTIMILDGTADISPMYRFHEDRYKKLNPWQFRKSLKDLFVHVIDVRTSKAALRKETDEYYADLFQDIRERIKPYIGLEDKPVVFTYEAIEKRFADEFGTENVEHIGNLRGFNDFTSAGAIAQIGVCQYPLEQYYLMTLIGDDEKRAAFQAMSAAEQRSAIVSETNSHDSDARRFMIKSILVDTEQNMFRGSVRELGAKHYHFFLYCRTRYYADMIAEMKKRYEKLDGKVVKREMSLAEEIADYMQRGNPNKRGNRIIRAIFSFDPNIMITPHDIYTRAGLTYRQFKETRDDTEVIQRLLAYDIVAENTFQNRFSMPVTGVQAQRTDEIDEAFMNGTGDFVVSYNEEDNLLPF